MIIFKLRQREGGIIIYNTKKKGGAKVNKIAIVLAVIAIAIFVGYRTGFIAFLTDIEALQAWFNSLSVFGYVIFILLYMVVAVFMLPASALTIASGITFGSVLGGGLSLIGGTLGAVAAFVIAKYLARDYIINKFGGNPIFKKIEDGVSLNGISFLILTRLVPVFPYNIQNYAYGVTSMNIGKFALISFITMAPGSFIYAFLAGEIVTNGVSISLLLQFAAAGVILFLVSLIPKYIAKKKGIKLD